MRRQTTMGITVLVLGVFLVWLSYIAASSASGQVPTSALDIWHFFGFIITGMAGSACCVGGVIMVLDDLT